jgi:beta-lactamase regulating signal transducer with metallopeptidase domain
VQFVLPSFLPVPVRIDNWLRSEAGAWPATALTWHGIFLLVWLVGAAGMASLLLGRAISARRLVAGAREGNNLMRGGLWYCRACMGVKGAVRLKVSEKISNPVVLGLVRPVILVPHNLAPTLGSRHLRSVLLNELAHVRRGDLWVNFLQTALQVVYFYNPVLWVANGVIRRVREQAVDETVVAAMGDKAQWYPETRANVSKLGGRRASSSRRGADGGGSKRTVAGRNKRTKKGPGGKNEKSHTLSLIRVVMAFLFAGFGR